MPDSLAYLDAMRPMPLSIVVSSSSWIHTSCHIVASHSAIHQSTFVLFYQHTLVFPQSLRVIGL